MSPYGTKISDKEALKKKIENKVAAEKRAHCIVEDMLELNIKEDIFVKAMNLITVDHYQDITEERAILRYCGYPLCSNILKAVPKQRYKISNNRVYDITNRKNFCSNICYRKSNHIKDQIPTSPLWMRPEESSFSLHDTTVNSGLPGDEIKLIKTVKMTEVENPIADDNIEDATPFETEESQPTPTPAVVTKEAPKPEIIKPKQYATKPKLLSTLKATPPYKPPPKSTPDDVAVKILGMMKEWLTEQSLVFLNYIPTEPKSIDATVNEISEEQSDNDKRVEHLKRKLDEKLDLLVSGFPKNHISSGDPVLHPLPNLPPPPPTNKTTACDAPEFTARVDAFYQGSLHVKEKAPIKKKTKDDDALTDSTAIHVYPTVDSKNQMTIRRKILFTTFCKVFGSRPVAEIYSHLEQNDLSHLIATFQLSKSNIVFKPKEFPILAVILSILMCRKSEEICKVLSSPTFKETVSDMKLDYGKFMQNISDVIITQFETVLSAENLNQLRKYVPSSCLS